MGEDGESPWGKFAIKHRDNDGGAERIPEAEYRKASSVQKHLKEGFRLSRF